MPPVSPSPATEPRRFTRLRHKPADADPDADTKLEHGATELRRFTRLRSKPANADADLDRDPDADADADADAASSAPMPSVNPSPATEPRRFTRLRYKQADADPDADTKLERGGTELMCFTRLRSKPGNANPDAELLRGASLSKRKSAAKARRTRGSAAKGDAGGAINDCIFAEEPDAEEMGEEGEEERATKKMVPRLSTNRRADASQDNFVGNPLPHGEARQPWIHWYTVKVVVIIEKLAVLYESRQQWSRAVQMLSGIDLDSGIRMLDDTNKLSKCVQIARLYLEVEALTHFEDDIEGLQQWDQQGDNKIGNYEDGETGSVEREAKKTQLFINLFGYRTIPIRENLSEVTVKQLVEFALKKEGFTLSDFYSTIPGKVLEPESLLSLYDIPRDGTITVTTRLRGGTVYHHLIELKPWNEVIAAIVRFEVVQLPQGLIGTVRNRTEGLNLSPDMQHYSIEALRELTRKHYIGICYGGDFTGEQILFENGQARFANSVEPQEYTHILARLDYRKMFEIFSHAFWAGPPMQYPLHVSDLLNFLLHPPENARPNSLGVIAYLSNHVSLLPYMLRVSASKILRCLIDGLDFVEFMTLPMLFRLIDWHALIRDVPAMNTILLYNPDPNAPGNVPMYGFQASECVRHSSNYYKHADHVQFTMKQLEAALALATDSVSFLPRMLQDLAIRVDGVQPNSPGLQRFLSSVLDLLGNRTIVGLNPEA